MNADNPTTQTASISPNDGPDKALREALSTITNLTRQMSQAKDMVIARHGLSDPLNNVLSYDVSAITAKLSRLAR